MYVVPCAQCIAFRLLAGNCRSIFTRRKNQLRLSACNGFNNGFFQSGRDIAIVGVVTIIVKSFAGSRDKHARFLRLRPPRWSVCFQIATDEPEASHIFAADFGMFEQQVRHRPRELGEFQKVRLKMLSTRCGATPSMKSILCCKNATKSRENSLTSICCATPEAPSVWRCNDCRQRCMPLACAGSSSFSTIEDARTLRSSGSHNTALTTAIVSRMRAHDRNTNDVHDWHACTRCFLSKKAAS